MGGGWIRDSGVPRMSQRVEAKGETSLITY